MANPALVDHNGTRFAKPVVQIRPGVWTAVGYSAADRHMIEVEDTTTVVDMSERHQGGGAAGSADNLQPRLENCGHLIAPGKRIKGKR